MKRPPWYPEWKPSSYPPFTFHSEVWDAAVVATVKAVIARLEEMNQERPGIWSTAVHRFTKDLRREVGLE